MVAYKGLGRGKKEYIAVDTTHVPHILAFEIRSIAPTDNLNGDIVPALAQVGGYVKLGIIVAALCVAYVIAVHPDERRTIYTVKVQEYAFVFPTGWHVEFAAVRCYGVG